MLQNVCDIERAGETVILTAKASLGEMDYDSFEEDAIAAFDLLSEEQVKNLVIDFDDSDYFGSNAVNLLLRLRNAVTESGGKMVLCGLSDHAKQILKVLKLESQWHICESRESALQQVVV